MVLNSRFRPALRNGIPEEVDFSLRQVFIPRPDKAAAIDANRSTTDASETDLGPTPGSPAGRGAQSNSVELLTLTTHRPAVIVNALL